MWLENECMDVAESQCECMNVEKSQRNTQKNHSFGWDEYNLWLGEMDAVDEWMNECDESDHLLHLFRHNRSKPLLPPTPALLCGKTLRAWDAGLQWSGIWWSRNHQDHLLSINRCPSLFAEKEETEQLKCGKAVDGAKYNREQLLSIHMKGEQNHYLITKKDLLLC